MLLGCYIQLYLPCCPVSVVVLDRDKIVRIFLHFIVHTIVLVLLYIKVSQLIPKKKKKLINCVRSIKWDQDLWCFFATFGSACWHWSKLVCGMLWIILTGMAWEKAVQETRQGGLLSLPAALCLHNFSELWNLLSRVLMTNLNVTLVKSMILPAIVNTKVWSEEVKAGFH